MDNQLLPVGTVVSYQNRKYMIAGYTWDEMSNRLVMLYVVVPYPQGYMKRAKLVLLQDSDFEVVEHGYTDERFRILEKYYTTINSVAEKTTASEMKQYLEEAYKINRLRGLE